MSTIQLNALDDAQLAALYSQLVAPMQTLDCWHMRTFMAQRMISWRANVLHCIAARSEHYVAVFEGPRMFEATAATLERAMAIALIRRAEALREAKAA